MFSVAACHAASRQQQEVIPLGIIRGLQIIEDHRAIIKGAAVQQIPECHRQQRDVGAGAKFVESWPVGPEKVNRKLPSPRVATKPKTGGAVLMTVSVPLRLKLLVSQ